jgi:succinyl-diaminopimelate desuccinylase
MHVSRICSDLVKIRSENPPGKTAEVIEYIQGFLDGIGISSTICGPGHDLANLVALHKDAPLMLCGHVDVVPALDSDWNRAPFSGDIADGYVWGRGATDMKGGCAAILSACKTLIDKGEEMPATLAFVCDEETGGENGIRYLLAKNALPPCDCLIAEPSPALHPSIGQKGLCRMSIAFKGVPAHGSLYPAVGTSAIMEAMSFLSWMRTLYDTDYPVDDSVKEIISHSARVMGEQFRINGTTDVLRRLTFNPGVIRGGEKSNVVAQACDLDLEMRVPWGCRISDLINDITVHAVNATVTTDEFFDPSITAPSSRIVAITCDEVGRTYGGKATPIVQWAASDARHLRKCGFPVIEYGPGEIACLHAVNERVPVVSLEKAARVYCGVMRRYAGITG